MSSSQSMINFEPLYNAYAIGNYPKAINFLDSYIKNQVDLYERILLAQVMCFQQMGEREKVISNTSKIMEITAINDTSSSNHIFCHVLALWYRSLAYESLENWEDARNDLEKLKILIKKGKNDITFKSKGILAVFLPFMFPIISQYNFDSILIDLSCIDDQQQNLVTKQHNNTFKEFHLVKSCNDLMVRKFNYHLILRKPLCTYIHVNMWYTLDLKFVDEMGFSVEKNQIKVKGYAFECKLLEFNNKRKESEEYGVQVRPMSTESCEWSDCTGVDWAGVKNDGKGGLEFCVVPIVKNTCNNKCSKSNMYLYIYPIWEIVGGISKETIQENYLVPLSIGPISIISCITHPSSCDYHLNSSSCVLSPWDLDNCCTNSTDTYRSFILPNGKYLIIKELWNTDTAGKVWDSALIIIQMIKYKILKGQTFAGKKILDLSTGNGFVGLYLATFISILQSKKKKKNSKTSITLSDMTLSLINNNLKLNKYLIDKSKVTINVKKLVWEKVAKSKFNNFGDFDYVLASDVVYIPASFDSLIKTLTAVCTPRRTKIYLGYKRRHLTEKVETNFFEELKEKFQISAVQGLDEEGNVKVYELSRE